MPNRALNADVGTIRKCVSCGETQRIEPLARVRGIWHLRCLHCRTGLRMCRDTMSATKERRTTFERRARLRGGRRELDVSAPLHCRHCQGTLEGWLRTAEGLWLRCRSCNRVEVSASGAGAAAMSDRRGKN
jgi:hypothetical protein